MSKNTTARDSGAAAPASRAGTPASSSSNRRIKDCTRCGKPASKKKCSRCLKHGLHVYYCSEACQQTDWKVHKKTCGPKYDGTLDALDQSTLDDADKEKDLVESERRDGPLSLTSLDLRNNRVSKGNDTLQAIASTIRANELQLRIGMTSGTSRCSTR